MLQNRVQMSFYGYDEDRLVELLGHSTTITLNNNKQIKGYLYTVDPLTKNIILYNDKVQLVMNHFIQAISIDTEDAMDLNQLNNIFEYKEDEYTTDWLDDRRQTLIQYLEKNHIPIEKKNETIIHVFGSARIEPPYTATTVICDNPLIRKRVRDLILDYQK